MIVDTKEAQCVMGVLEILSKNKGRYNSMFRKTKVSHTTLQKVLRDLEQRDFIKKQIKGHMKIDYEITEKGRNLLSLLKNLSIYLR